MVKVESLFSYNNLHFSWSCVKDGCQGYLLINPAHDVSSIVIKTQHSCNKNTHESLSSRKLMTLLKATAKICLFAKPKEVYDYITFQSVSMIYFND